MEYIGTMQRPNGIAVLDNGDVLVSECCQGTRCVQGFSRWVLWRQGPAGDGWTRLVDIEDDLQNTTSRGCADGFAVTERARAHSC